ncbi:non-heme iron oxygenase ferredoxin subunit [Poseidonocella sp. HB161398]|uniref:Rieske (2Fe-2S) protein n=1 Tax=Poseidonocella sp. HB161398 TaxID=2320855 RepID=UPI00148758AE|nr:non-heme iron oxygenase ferredoxin subunit [Poseidonocella sp. HB161398]
MTQTSEMVKVLESAALEEGGMTSVNVGEEEVALYRVEGVVYATSNICSHAYAIMTEGYLDGDCIECPLHQALFSIKTGEPVDAPTDKPLPVFATEERDGAIYVRV